MIYKKDFLTSLSLNLFIGIAGFTNDFKDAVMQEDKTNSIGEGTAVLSSGVEVPASSEQERRKHSEENHQLNFQCEELAKQQTIIERVKKELFA